VAAGHPATCEAAAETLRGGGNAFDAAVAAGFAAAVVEPALTGLGGGGFLLARTAAGDARLFDFFVDTPGRGLAGAPEQPDFEPVTVRFGHADQVFNVGLGSVAVPGCLPGYLHVHRSLGRIPLARVLAPAIRLARDGVALNAEQAYLLEILQPILSLSEAGRRIYSRDGRPLGVGEGLVNADLSTFLERLVESAASADFAEAGLAQRIAADMESGGGHVSVADLEAYRVRERTPLSFEYRGVRVLANPPPSFGGTLVAISLRLLEADGAMPPWGSAAHVERLVDSMIETEAVRARSEAAARLRSAQGTTHVSVGDGEGNVASMTTSNGENSGYIVPGTGVMLNNMLGEEDLHPDGFHAGPPGERVASMMCPTVLLRDDAPWLVLGSGGSKRIRTALAQVISNAVDYGMDPRSAVEAPRLHWDGSVVQLEPGGGVEALAALAARWPLNRWSQRNLYFGGVHAVGPGPVGAGDPRRGGSVAFG
jgi:gamma-glutamyltranspeptidase/glutathione hydrolase